MSMQEMNRENLFDLLCRMGMQFKTGFIITNPCEPNNPILFTNPQFSEITGYASEEVLGKNSKLLEGEDTNKETIKEIMESLHKNLFTNKEILNYKKDGTPFWNDLVIQPISNQDGQVLFHLAFLVDITKQKQEKAVLYLQKQIYMGIEKGEELSMLLQKICQVAEGFFPQGARCSILEITSDRKMIIGSANSLPQEYNDTINGLAVGLNVGTCGTAAATGQYVVTEDIRLSSNWKQFIHITEKYNMRSCWSFPVNNHENRVIATFGIYFSEPRRPTQMDLEFIQTITPLVLLTLKNAEHQKEILKLAYVDIPSELPNYNYFVTEFTKLMEKTEEGFLLMIQPSEYVNIVDSFGKQQLSFLLKQLGERFAEISNGMDIIIARSSEASLIIAGKCGEAEIPQYINKLLNTTKEAFVLEKMDLYISLRTGVVSFRQYTGDTSELIRMADIALSHARKKAGNSVVYYKEQYGIDIAQKMALQNELELAIKTKQFYVNFQPKVNLHTGEIVSFEALARWNSSKLGQVSPFDFIEAAESIGKIHFIDMIVLEKVLEWLQTRKIQGLTLYKVSVNISANHFYEIDFVQKIASIIHQFEIDPVYICLELTESIGLFDLELANNKLNELKMIGVSSSVDDFGMGFSSLSYLHQLPIAEMKIDRSFIQEIHNPGAKTIVQTLILLAKNLNLTVVAEGIETKEQVEILTDLNCRVGQGFYFFKPMSLDQIDAILKT
ncbi:MAG: EAL domain-containing protein [Psychrobacillus psychrotolerans]